MYASAYWKGREFDAVDAFVALAREHGIEPVTLVRHRLGDGQSGDHHTDHRCEQARSSSKPAPMQPSSADPALKAKSAMSCRPSIPVMGGRRPR
jgi:hypothetical protein